MDHNTVGTETIGVMSVGLSAVVAKKVGLMITCGIMKPLNIK